MSDNEIETYYSRYWGGCRLVNPLCPDDLCLLERDHSGTKTNRHHLGTMIAKDRVSRVMYVDDTCQTATELVRAGSKKARELFPQVFA